MTKYKYAGNKLGVANHICPATSKPQVLDMKSWPCPPNINNLEDATSAEFDKNKCSGMAKYKMLETS